MIANVIKNTIGTAVPATKASFAQIIRRSEKNTSPIVIIPSLTK